MSRKFSVLLGIEFVATTQYESLQRLLAIGPGKPLEQKRQPEKPH